MPRADSGPGSALRQVPALDHRESPDRLDVDIDLPLAPAQRRGGIGLFENLRINARALDLQRMQTAAKFVGFTVGPVDATRQRLNAGTALAPAVDRAAVGAR